MGKIAVLAEKPSVARDIARVLGCRVRGDGFIEGDSYVVTWAVGHLASLFEPEDYSPDLKRWRMDSLPIIPDEMRIKPVESTGGQLEKIAALINSDRVDSLVCATDSGREGELIFRYVYKLAGCSKPFKRLWISSMTDEAIRAGFADLRDGSEYDLLYQSARCRSEADWLVGINASRAFSVMYDANLSIGRVQTPTLAMIVARQREIDSFSSKSYFEVASVYDSFTGCWFREKGGARESRIESEREASAIAMKVAGKEGTVSSLESEEKQAPPPLLYDLTELQRDANKRYGYSAEKTLNVVQDLYEKRKSVTYPRTDSRYLSSDMEPLLPVIMGRLRFPPYGDFASAALSSGMKAGKRIIDDSKITDHHAIIPTNSNIDIGAYSQEERAVFDLIARRFIAVFFPYNVFTVTRCVVSCEGETFLSKGKMVLQPGWTALYEGLSKAVSKGKSGDDAEQALPPLSEGMRIAVRDARVVPKKTKPPAQYTEAALLSAMEHAGRFVEDESLREQLKDGGLGTPATRAGIIERLISVGYMRRSGKSLVPTEKGMKLIDVVPREMRSPETTGKWEKGLASIYRGSMAPERFMESIKRYVVWLVSEASRAASGVDFGERGVPSGALGRCPACGKGGIFEGASSFYCSRWRQGCRFSFRKSAFEKRGGFAIDSAMARELLSSGACRAGGGTVTYKSSEGLRFIPGDSSLPLQQG